MVLILSSGTVNLPEINGSFDEANVMPFLALLGVLHSFNTILDNSRLQLAPSIKSCNLWCQTRTLLLPVAQAGKMSATMLISHFSSHSAAFGFWSSLPYDNITLNPASKRTGQSLSDFQTGIGTSAYATLETQHLISDTRAALVDTSVHGSDGRLIAASGVHLLLIRIHFILDSALSKLAANTANILAYLFNFAPTKCH